MSRLSFLHHLLYLSIFFKRADVEILCKHTEQRKMEERGHSRTHAVAIQERPFVPCPPCSFIVDPVSKKATFPLRFQPQRTGNATVSSDSNVNSFHCEQQNTEFQRIGAHRARKPNYKRYPKPPYSYTGMIATSIMNSKDRRLTLCDIQKCIENMFPFFRGEYKGWRDSVRHNLSHSDAFIKINKNTSRMNSKFNFWTVDLNKLPTDVFRRKTNDRESRYAEYLHDELGIQEIKLPSVCTTDMKESHNDSSEEPPAKRFKSDTMDNSLHNYSELQRREVYNGTTKQNLHSITDDFRDSPCNNSNGRSTQSFNDRLTPGLQNKMGTMTTENHNLYNELDNLIEQSLFKASSSKAVPVFDYGLMQPELEKSFSECKYADYSYPALNASLILNKFDMACNSDVYAVSPAQVTSSRVTRYSHSSTPIKQEEQEISPDLSTSVYDIPKLDSDINPSELSLSNIFDV